MIFGSNIGLDLLKYDPKDIKEISTLCHVAYEHDKSIYYAQLEKEGWNIQQLKSESNYAYGVQGINGPLKIIAYKGSDDPKTYISDLNAIRLSTKTIFPNFEKSVIHKGIYTYYKELESQKHFSKIDEDQFLIFTGHSLGGALCNIAGLELATLQQSKPENYPQNFCSLLTLGAPPILGHEIRNTLNSFYPNRSHYRFFFENDPFVKVTRCERKTLNINESLIPFSDDREFIFVHGGDAHELQSSGLLSHKCKTYIKKIESEHLSFLSCNDSEPIYYKFINSYYFHPTHTGLLGNLRSFEAANEVKVEAINLLKSVWWDGNRNIEESTSECYYPSRGADLLFYQLWRLEELYKNSEGNFSNMLKILDERYRFFDRYYYKNTILYFDRMVKELGIKYEYLKCLLSFDQNVKNSQNISIFISNYLKSVNL